MLGQLVCLVGFQGHLDDCGAGVLGQRVSLVSFGGRLGSRSSAVPGQMVGELLERWLGKHGWLPHVWCQVGVGVADSLEGSLGKVAQSSRGSSGAGVAVLNSSHGQQLLWYWSTDDSCTTGCWDESHQDTTAPPSHLTRDCVGFPQLVTPVTPPHRDNGKLGQGDSTTDGSGHFLGTLDPKSNVAVVVADGYKGLESGPLAGPGLLLYRHDLEDLVLESCPQEELDDLCLLDGE